MKPEFKRCLICGARVERRGTGRKYCGLACYERSQTYLNRGKNRKQHAACFRVTVKNNCAHDVDGIARAREALAKCSMPVSARLRLKASVALADLKAPDLATKSCGICGAPFESSRESKIFCSTECRWEANRRRSRAHAVRHRAKVTQARACA